MFSLRMRFLFTLICCFGLLLAHSQQLPEKAPYLRYPTLPPMQLLLSDSTTRFTRSDIPPKKAVLLMIFSPDCSHCQHTAEELVANKEKLKNLYIVMATLHPLSQMNAFVQQYRLQQIPNLIVGKDYSYILPSFYGIRNLPYLAFYNKKGKLITGFEGSMPLDRILKTFE